MVPRIELRAQPGRRLRVAHCRVEVDDRIKLTGLTYPCVDLAAQDLLCRVVKIGKRPVAQGSGKRRQSGADGAQTMGAGPGDQLAVGTRQGNHSWQWCGRGEHTPRPADIVEAQHQNHGVNTRLREHIPVEPRQRINPHAVSQHAPARDTLVQHRHGRSTGRQQAFGQHIGPAPIGIGCRAIAIGDRIAQHHHRARRSRGLDPHGTQEQPRSEAGLGRQLGL